MANLLEKLTKCEQQIASAHEEHQKVTQYIQNAEKAFGTTPVQNPEQDVDEYK